MNETPTIDIYKTFLFTIGNSEGDGAYSRGEKDEKKTKTRRSQEHPLTLPLCSDVLQLAQDMKRA